VEPSAICAAAQDTATAVGMSFSININLQSVERKLGLVREFLGHPSEH
jgi:hypothetical protein